MKIKILFLALFLTIANSLAYARILPAPPPPAPRGLAPAAPARAPLDVNNITPATMAGRSIDEIVAFAVANPTYINAIAFNAITSAENSEQATLIARALIAKFPLKEVDIKAALVNAFKSLDEYKGAINSKVLYSEAVVNPTQDTINNIQASANQGKITQQLANLLIATLVIQSGGSSLVPPPKPPIVITAPLRPQIPPSRS